MKAYCLYWRERFRTRWTVSHTSQTQRVTAALMLATYPDELTLLEE